MKKGDDSNFYNIYNLFYNNLFLAFFRFHGIHFATGNRVDPGKISFLVLSILQERNL